MNTYSLFVTALVLTFNHASGKIRNGYEREIQNVTRSLNCLHEILRNNPDLSLQEKRSVRAKIKSHMDYVAYYEITENLLNEFRSVAPEMYQQIETIKDRMGRTTDVYVKLIPKNDTKVKAAGTTGLAYAKGDYNAYHSEYGLGTVSIKIWIVTKALWVLAHEFGHVKYQVPNLRDYITYYRYNYSNLPYDANHIGHQTQDPSGKSALCFEKQFRRHYATHFRSGYKPKSPVHALEYLRQQRGCALWERE